MAEMEGRWWCGRQGDLMKEGLPWLKWKSMPTHAWSVKCIHNVNVHTSHISGSTVHSWMSGKVFYKKHPRFEQNLFMSYPMINEWT
jgi:hypothetical protein